MRSYRRRTKYAPSHDIIPVGSFLDELNEAESVCKLIHKPTGKVNPFSKMDEGLTYQAMCIGDAHKILPEIQSSLDNNELSSAINKARYFSEYFIAKARTDARRANPSPSKNSSIIDRVNILDDRIWSSVLKHIDTHCPCDETK